MIDAIVLIWALTLARVGTFIYVLPLLGGPTIPRTVKIGLAMALTVFFYPDAAEGLSQAGGLSLASSNSWLVFVVAIGREIILGGILGFALNLFLVPARVAGEFISEESGLTMASVLTATGNGSASPFGTLFEMLASVAFFSLDLHHIFLQLLQETFRSYPVGAAFSMPNWDLITAASFAEEGGLMLAAPIAICLVLTTIVLMLLARAAPQLNLFSFGFALRVIVCVAAMILLLPQLMKGIVEQFAWMIEILGLQR